MEEFSTDELLEVIDICILWLKGRPTQTTLIERGGMVVGGVNTGRALRAIRTRIEHSEGVNGECRRCGHPMRKPDPQDARGEGEGT